MCLYVYIISYHIILYHIILYYNILYYYYIYISHKKNGKRKASNYQKYVALEGLTHINCFFQLSLSIIRGFLQDPWQSPKSCCFSSTTQWDVDLWILFSTRCWFQHPPEIFFNGEARHPRTTLFSLNSTWSHGKTRPTLMALTPVFIPLLKKQNELGVQFRMRN